MKNEYEIKTIEKSSPLFPTNLLILKDCPEKLYLIGNENILNKFSVSIVGTRHSSRLGNEIAKEFASNLAKNDLVIISRWCLWD